MTSAIRFAAAALVIALAACTVDTRSGPFRCDDGVCDDGRICERGWCVETSLVDAAPFVCPGSCDRCEGNLCVVECDSADDCGEVTCPADLPCQVRCTGFASCPDPVDCDDASACDVLCLGEQSCAGGVECAEDGGCSVSCDGEDSCLGAITSGDGATQVSCDGPDSCGGGVDCTGACSCDVDCGGLGSCQVPAACPNNCGDGDGCRNNTGNCDRC